MGNPSKSRQCELDDCSKPYKSNGFCAMHWWRWRHYGDPYHLERQKGHPCRICGGPHEAQGYCDGHYRAWKRTGDPHDYHPPVG